MAWTSIHDNTNWVDGGQPSTFLWTPSQWAPSIGGLAAALTAIGTWAAGYSPTQMRMTLVTTGHEITIKDTNGDTIGYNAWYTSGDIIALTFGSFDIDEILFNGAGVDSNLVITDIEFWVSISSTTTMSTTSSTVSSTSTTTTEPPRRWEGAYYYRFTQATANRMPDWTRSKNYRYSNTQQLLQPFGQESEEMNTRMRRHLASLFLGTMDMDQMDMVYQISLPYSFEFEFDFTDPTNPRPKPPYTRGIIGTTEIVIESIEENNIESFWYDPLPTRITIGDDEIDLDPGDTGLLATGDVLPATAIGAGIVLPVTFTDPFVPGRLYVTIAGGDKFGHKDDLVESPAYVELEGVTVKDTEEVERVYFYYNATKITKKYWKEITKATIYNTLPSTATLMITSVGATLQQIQDPAYVEFDTVGGRSSYWELDESNTTVMLQQILPVARVITGEARPGFQQDVHRSWILQDELGIELPWADVADYTLERFRPYMYVLMEDGTLHIYNKWPEYPDITSIRFLKERTDSCNTWIDVSYDEGILDDEVRLSAQVIAPTKSVAFYSLQGSKPSHDNDWYYIDTDGVWGGTEIDARVTLEVPSSDLPYIGYVVPLDEHGVHAFKLETRYLDGTNDVDVVLIWSRYKQPLATFDLAAVDPDLITPLAICFDYNQTLWLGGLFATGGPDDFLFKELDLHADLMLVDYDKKLLYLREEYDEVWVNDLTPPTPTGGTWIEVFTDARWADDVTYLGGHFTWTGTEWEQLSTPYTGQLVPIGTWHLGYRPVYMRITFSGPSTVRVRLKDEDGLSVVDELSYSSGEIMTLYWNDTDIAELEFQWEDTGFTVDAATIEFYQLPGEGYSSTTTTSTTTTTTASTASTVSSTSTTSTTAPPLLSCITPEDYFRMTGETPEWDLEPEISITNGILTKVGTNPRSAAWTIEPLDGTTWENATPFVLPLVTAEIKLTAISSLCEDVFTVQSAHPVSYQVIKIRVDDSTREIYVQYITSNLLGHKSYIWDESVGTWVTGGPASSYETWTFDEWWKLDMERNSNGEWRISIKDETSAQVILTDWVKWRDLEFEDRNSVFRGNAATIYFGQGNTGPHGFPEGQIRNVAFCTGWRRFLYTNFSTANASTTLNNIFDITTSGAGGTISCNENAYKFNLNAKSGVPSVISATQTGFSNTGVQELDEFDVWGAINIPSLTTEADTYLQWLLEAHNTGGTHEAGLRLRWINGPNHYQIEYQAKDDSAEDNWVFAAVVGVSIMWFRMKWQHTRVRMYYATSDPTIGGWTEIIPATASPNMSNLIQVLGADFTIEAYNDITASKEFNTWDLEDGRLTSWPGETTSTTSTTTTTSTTATQPPWAFRFDEFDDASIHPRWDTLWTNGAGGTATEQNDRLEFLLEPRAKTSSMLSLSQTGLEGFSTPGDWTSGFDVYGKLRIPVLSDLIKNSSGETIFTQAEMRFTGGGNTDQLYIQLYWNGTEISIRWFVTDGSNADSGTAVTGITQNEIWFRFYYLPKNGEIYIYYSLTEPFSAGWTWISVGKPQPQPGAHTDLDFTILSSSADTGRQILTYCEYVRDYDLFTVASIDHGTLGGEISRGNEPTWSDARDTADAEVAGPPWGVPYGYLTQVSYIVKDGYDLDRSLLEFDLSSIPDGATITYAELVMNYGGPAFGLTTTFIAQEANFGGTFEVGDYDSFFGPILGSQSIGSANWNATMVLNSDGIAAVQNNLVDNLLQICFREFYYDYSGSTPGAGFYYRAHYEYDNPITLRVVYTL